MCRVELAAVPEYLGDHRARRLADEGAEEQSLDWRETESDRDDVTDRRRREDLQRTADERNTSDAQQVAHRQLETDGKEEEAESDVRERADGLRIRARAVGVRPD